MPGAQTWWPRCAQIWSPAGVATFGAHVAVCVSCAATGALSGSAGVAAAAAAAVSVAHLLVQLQVLRDLRVALFTICTSSQRDEASSPASGPCLLPLPACVRPPAAPEDCSCAAHCSVLMRQEEPLGSRLARELQVGRPTKWVCTSARCMAAGSWCGARGSQSSVLQIGEMRAASRGEHEEGVRARGLLRRKIGRPRRGRDQRPNADPAQPDLV